MGPISSVCTGSWLVVALGSSLGSHNSSRLQGIALELLPALELVHQALILQHEPPMHWLSAAARVHTAQAPQSCLADVQVGSHASIRWKGFSSGPNASASGSPTSIEQSSASPPLLAPFPPCRMWAWQRRVAGRALPQSACSAWQRQVDAALGVEMAVLSVHVFCADCLPQMETQKPPTADLNACLNSSC